MPRKASAPQAPISPRRWRYLDETPRVLTNVRHASGATLLAHPGGVYELHPDHFDVAEGDEPFGHPLLEETDAECFDPTWVEPEPEPEPNEPAGDDDTENDSPAGDGETDEETA